MKSCSFNRDTRSKLVRIVALVIFMFFLDPFTPADCQQVRGQMQKPPLKDRLFFGGNIGLQFGTYTNINISPIIGLWVFPRLAVAAGPSFTFYKDPYGNTTIYGGKAYTEIIFLQDLNNLLPIGIHLGLFLHGEWEGLSLESAYFKQSPNDAGRFWINTFLGGGGIRQQLGPRSAMDITFLWAFNDSGYYVYGNPEIRVSFMF